jgi:hypothetical protein
MVKKTLTIGMLLLVVALLPGQGRAREQPFSTWSDPPGAGFEFRVSSGDTVTWYYSDFAEDVDVVRLTAIGPYRNAPPWPAYEVEGVTLGSSPACCQVGWYSWEQPFPDVISYTIRIVEPFDTQLQGHIIRIEKDGIEAEYYPGEVWRFRYKVFLPIAER